MNRSHPKAFAVQCALAVASAAALTACGGGSATDAPETSPPAPYFGLGEPAPFVAQATPLPAQATEFERQMQMAQLNVGSATDIMKPKFCFEPGTGSDAALQDASVVPPTQLFDDFYYIGQVRWGSYALRSDDGGFILFDTLESATAAQTILVPGLQQAGLNPQTLRSIQITHGHSDHDGGAPYLQTTYRPDSLYATTGDYVNKTYTATHLVDSAVTSPFNLSIAGKSIVALSTPGHTAGTLSYIVPVKYKGVQHKLAYLGGSAFPGTAAMALQYLRSTERMYDLVKETGADGSVNSHTFFDKSDARMQQIRAKGIADSNPMIQGNAKILQSFSVLRQCSAALLANRDATARNPVWRLTQTDLYAAKTSAGTVSAAARVSNVFSVLPGVKVSFKDSTGASCTATTDGAGIAACSIQPSGSVSPTSITASFDGAFSVDAVDLGSASSRSLSNL